MRRLLLVVAVLLAALEIGSVSVAHSAGGPGSPRRGARKLRVSDPRLVRELQAQGGRLLADYGSYALVEVDAAAAPALLRDDRIEVRDEENLILLNTRTIDTTADEASALREPTEALAGRRLRLVQFVGPVRPDWHEALQETGVTIVSYVPHNTYLVYGDDVALAQVQEMAAARSFVQWEGAFRSQDRVHPSAAPNARGRRADAPATGLYAIQMVSDPSANAETLSVVDRLRVGDIRSRSRLLGYENVIATLDAASLAALAERPDVVSIQPYVVPRKRDESQGQIVAGNLTVGGPTGPGYLEFLASRGFTQEKFTASGFLVDITDSGIDDGTTSPNHFALYAGGTLAGASRVAYNRLEGTPHVGSTLQGCDGHGNVNAHILAGFSDLTGSTHEDGAGLNYGLGIAPFVRVGSSVIFDPSTYTFPNLANLQSRAYGSGARASSNSWGAAVNGAYTVDSQTFDALVRDAQPAGAAVPATGNQQMVVVFAAGNQGPTTGTLNAPGTAKNVITVGASEGVRAIGGSDQCGASDLDANNAFDIAYFSSRGPTTDGRRKPDLVAPGTHVTGGVAQADNPGTSGTALLCYNASGVCGGTTGGFHPPGQQFYTASSGTSHSTPAVAGGVALVRQHFINLGLTPPSPAMTKAFLMGSARYLMGSAANDTLWSNAQGMGLMDLGRAFDGGDRVLRDQLPEDTFTATGQTRTFAGTITDPGQPFRVTLAWTDAPGSTVGNAFKNDLDLTVRVGAVSYRGNVFSGASSVAGGSADPRNNVESVFLPAGATGTFSVTVAASNINSDGVPGSGTALDQDFALVVFNGLETPVPNVVPAGATIVTEGCGPGNGALDPGETVTVSFGLANVGTGPTLDLQATLLPTGGVNGPSGPESYGALAPGAPAVARPFTFMASGTCGGTLTATLQLQDGGSDLGTASFGFALGALAPGSSGTFTSSASITINTSGSATPYPSSLTVSGLSGTITRVTATLTNLSHSYPDDVDVMLVSPGGQSVLLLSDAGGGGAVSGRTLTFDDAAASAVPDGSPLVSGTFRPSNYEGTASDTFPAPAPLAPYGLALAALNGASPNGTWRLFVRDDFTGIGGSIAGGWSVSIQTAAPACCAAAAGIRVSPPPLPVTSEAGGTASFSVVLGSSPTADVTIGLASSDTTEGTVSPATLTFTAASAFTPQTVTVTGVDDAAVDGDVAYSILIGAAVSTDPAYNGLDPADVSLTNHDDDLLLVPLVVAAGGSLVAEGCAPGNGVIDPDETVTVNLALANTGTGPTTALVATLLPTGGVTAPSGPQTYGVLLPGAGAVALPFTFTAAGTCGGTVAATLQLQDGLSALGTVSFSFTMGVFTGGAPVTFSNAASVTINQASSATPFPSSIGVSGVSGTLTKLTVTLASLSHSFPDDVDILLVGPHNEKVLLLSDAGGGGVASNLSLTFDDGAGAFVPDGGPLASGTFRPSNHEGASDTFSSPAPAPPYGSALSAFNGSDPNGTWSLYVTDDFSSGGSGSIAGGWSLTLTTSTPVCCAPAPSGITVSPTSGLVTSEGGGTATFTVVLHTQPAADVTMGLSSSNLTEGSVSPPFLTFSPGDALTPQTVTVTGVDDTTADGAVAYSIRTEAVVSSDPGYGGLDAADVQVTNTDNDAVGIVVTPVSGLVTTEAGGTAAFSVVLTSTPLAPVTIPLGSSDTTEGTVSPASLVFTLADALTPQTVTVSGVDDLVADGSVAYSIGTAPPTSTDPGYAGLDAPDVAVSNTDDEAADLIFKDGFESGDLSRWSSSKNSGARLSVSAAAALDGTRGLSAFVNNTTALYVQDDTPAAAPRYRARFRLDPNGFDPGEATQTSPTAYVLAAYQGTSTRVVTLVLRRLGGQYSLQAQVRLDSSSSRNSSFVSLSDAPHAIELDWKRSTAAGANNGSFTLWIDGAPLATLTGLDTETRAVDLVRLGPQALKTGALGTLYFDRFESRRESSIGF